MKRQSGPSLLPVALLTVWIAGGLASCDDAGPDNTDQEPPIDVPGPEVPAPVACTRLGEHYPADDTCNWCTCSEDGIETCTERTCAVSDNTCDYNGETHGYAERFAAADGCNECVCAASGLACTRRACSTMEDNDSAILLESLDATCGGIPTLTGNSVLGYVVSSYDVPLDYNQAGSIYPESLPDARITVNMAYDGGYVVCRPLPGQEAIDIEAKMEIISSDGAFNEGLHPYFRHTNSVFTDNVSVLAVIDSTANLHGTYNPGCSVGDALMVSASFESDGALYGDMSKVCEGDMALVVAAWERLP